MHYKFNTRVSIALMIQTVLHRCATVFILLKQLAILTTFHTQPHFKPNESQIPVFIASPNSPWQLQKFSPMAETKKTAARQFSV